MASSSPATRRRQRLPAAEYVAGIRDGDRTVLARAITLVESDLPSDVDLASEVIEACLPHSGHSRRVGITGRARRRQEQLHRGARHPPDARARRNRRGALRSIRPARVSGGSILGDKTRMERLATDDRAFIRPSPSRGHLGGVARRTREAMLLCEAAGYQNVFVETVGVGQSETTVRSMTDFFLLLMLAGAGDELQGMKRGILEMTDLIAINKADGDNRRRAERARHDYESALHLFPASADGWTPRVLTCSALEREGVAEIWERGARAPRARRVERLVRAPPRRAGARVDARGHPARPRAGNPARPRRHRPPGRDARRGPERAPESVPRGAQRPDRVPPALTLPAWPHPRRPGASIAASWRGRCSPRSGSSPGRRCCRTLFAGLQGIVDHALVGHFVGYTANAAIGVSWQIILVVITFIASLYTGTAIFVARAAGAGDGDGVNRVVYQAFIASLLLAGLVLAPAGYVLAPYLLDVVNAAPEVKHEALPFLRIMLTCSVGMLVFFMLGGAFRAAGDAKTPLRLGIAVTILNVLLNVVLIRGLGPIPALGTAGAAIGTVTANAIVGGAGLLWLFSGRSVIRWSRTMDWRIDWPLIRSLFAFGLPAGFQGIAMNVAGLLLLRFIGSLGQSAAGPGRVRRRLRRVVLAGDVDVGRPDGRGVDGRRPEHGRRPSRTGARAAP